MNFGILFAMTFLFCAALSAEDVPQTFNNISALVKKALTNNEQVLAKKAQIEQSKAFSLHEGAFKNPSVSLAGGAQRAEKSWSPEFEIELSQSFYFPKVRTLRQEVAGFDAEFKEVELSETTLQISAEVIRLAYSYVVQEHKVKYATRRKHRFNLLQSYLARHTFASPQQKTSSIIVHERLRNLDAEVRRLDSDLATIRVKLEYYIGDIAGDSLALPWLKGTKELNEQTWIEQALRKAPEIVKSEIVLRKANAEAGLLRREIWPEFSIKAFFSQEHDPIISQTIGLGFSLAVPLWNRNQSALTATSQKLIAENHLLDAHRRNVKSFIKALIAEYEVKRNIAVDLPIKSIKNLDDAVEKMEHEFRKNRIDLLLFLELDTQAFDSITHILDAQLALVEALIALLTATHDESIIANFHSY